MERRAPTVFIVDDDAAFCHALNVDALAAGHRVSIYADAESFLADCDVELSGCVVAESRLRGMGGLELQTELKRRHIHWPLIFVTAHATVKAAVTAMRNGAADFLEKPVAAATLLDVIDGALKLEEAMQQGHSRRQMIAASLEKLTSRERQIMRFVIAGKMNKTIADELCISIKTVEAHRARVMQKVGVDSVAALVQLALQIEDSASRH
jgi:FixJ family two-component response regulator